MNEKEIKDRILAKSEVMFLQFGYSKVTMEEIAANLGISKKTLYKFFPSKEGLVHYIIENMKCGVDEYIDELWNDSSLDFVKRLKKLMDFFAKQSSKLQGPLLNDLQKSIPGIWKEINEFRKKSTLKKMTLLINEGIEKGIFRKDINQQIILLMYLNTIQGIINPETLSQLPLSGDQAFEIIIKIMFEGIFTEEGREKYISY
ncbi:MAG TPA: TetR/AcrR family transcriptional regulator, partial [Ignavibacteria bacterium]|nr:TetR/AcrR family transcriptional regulator [Ignavibacteria bacterium]